MSLSELVRRLARLLAAVVLAFSGGFIIIYLLRWEWNRALIAGMFFLAAEVFLVADLIVGRLRRMDRRLDREHEAEQLRALAAQLRRTRPAPKGPFPWLSDDRDRTFVLVPILLGAGVILSAVAYLVERLSRVTAAPVAEHELARGLASMALPAGGLAPTGQAPLDELDSPRVRDTRERRNGWIIALLIVVLTAVILALVVTLITRPTAPEQDQALVVDMVVDRNDLAQPPGAVAASMWTICRVRVPQEVRLVSLAPVDDDPSLQRLIVAPAPGLFDTRELTGCLQDAIVDRAWVEVASVRTVEQW